MICRKEMRPFVIFRPKTVQFINCPIQVHNSQMIITEVNIEVNILIKNCIYDDYNLDGNSI